MKEELLITSIHLKGQS